MIVISQLTLFRGSIENKAMPTQKKNIKRNVKNKWKTSKKILKIISVYASSFSECSLYVVKKCIYTRHKEICRRS